MKKLLLVVFLLLSSPATAQLLLQAPCIPAPQGAKILKDLGFVLAATAKDPDGDLIEIWFNIIKKQLNIVYLINGQRCSVISGKELDLDRTPASPIPESGQPS